MRPDSVGNRSGQVSPEVIQLLSVLPSASIVFGAGGAVLWASPRSMAIGLVRRGQLAVPELGEVVAKAVAEGAVREEQLRVRRPPLGRDECEHELTGITVVLVLLDSIPHALFG
ncbi:MAG: hypothetical protein ACKN9D_12450 [Actinomycetales bacterium]